MSIFKSITTAANEEVLVNSSQYSANSNITISKIKVTNHGTTGAITVSVFIDNDPDEYIFKTSVPQDTTLIFDDTFSYPQTKTLKVTTSGNSNITIVVN